MSCLRVEPLWTVGSTDVWIEWFHAHYKGRSELVRLKISVRDEWSLHYSPGSKLIHVVPSSYEQQGVNNSGRGQTKQNETKKKGAILYLRETCLHSVGRSLLHSRLAKPKTSRTRIWMDIKKIWSDTGVTDASGHRFDLILSRLEK